MSSGLLNHQYRKTITHRQRLIIYFYKHTMFDISYSLSTVKQGQFVLLQNLKRKEKKKQDLLPSPSLNIKIHTTRTTLSNIISMICH